MNLNMQNLVAQNMKKMRNVFGYTQAEIAEELHINRSTYTQYESGRKVPSTDTLIDLAAFYDIRLDVLLDANTNTFIQRMFSQDRYRNDIAQLINAYHKLSPYAQGKLVERAEMLLENEQKEKR